MTDQHPMTPPTELLTRWENDWFNEREHADVLLVNAYAAGAQAGADQELEACCEWLRFNSLFAGDVEKLRAARRSKPPSLKEQALALLQPGEPRLFNSEMQDTIRRALEQLDD